MSRRRSVQSWRAATVGVVGAGEQHGRGDLAEAVEHPGGAEVRRRGAEHRAEPGRGQHDGAGLGAVGHPGRHPVPGPHSGVDQKLLHPARHVVQLGSGELGSLAVLAAEDDGDVVGWRSEQVLGHVQAGVGQEPGCAAASRPGRRTGRCRGSRRGARPGRRRLRTSPTSRPRTRRCVAPTSGAGFRSRVRRPLGDRAAIPGSGRGSNLRLAQPRASTAPGRQRRWRSLRAAHSV